MDKMNGVWLLPTRMRLKTLQRFLDAAIQTECSTPGWILVSINEYTIREGEYDALRMPKNWKIVYTHVDGMGDKFREIFPRVKDMDWIGWLVDDVIPMTPHWDTEMINGLNGKNVISCNDAFRAPARMCAPVFSGDLLRAVGWIYPDGFWHTYVDDVWETLGKITQTWFVCMDVVLKHEDAFQTGKVDFTHEQSYGQNDADAAAFQAWRRNDMDAAVIRIIDLLENKNASQ